MISKELAICHNWPADTTQPQFCRTESFFLPNRPCSGRMTMQLVKSSSGNLVQLTLSCAGLADAARQFWCMVSGRSVLVYGRLGHFCAILRLKRIIPVYFLLLLRGFTFSHITFLKKEEMALRGSSIRPSVLSMEGRGFHQV